MQEKLVNNLQKLEIATFDHFELCQQPTALTDVDHLKSWPGFQYDKLSQTTSLNLPD